MAGPSKRGHVRPYKNVLFPKWVTVSNLVALGQTVWAYTNRCPKKNWECWGPRLLGTGVADPLMIPHHVRFSINLACRVWSLVVKTVCEHMCRDPPEKLGLLCPSFQGHSSPSTMWHSMTLTRRLRMSHGRWAALLLVINRNNGPLSYRFQDNKRHLSKNEKNILYILCPVDVVTPDCLRHSSLYAAQTVLVTQKRTSDAHGIWWKTDDVAYNSVSIEYQKLPALALRFFGSSVCTQQWA